MSSILRRASWFSFLLILTATAAAAAEGAGKAAAKATETTATATATATATTTTTAEAPDTASSPAAAATVDAWGNHLDLDREAQADMMEGVAAQMGSADWGALALRFLETEGTILPRLARGMALDIECGKRYRRAHPEHSRDQYGAYLETEAGSEWENACLVAQLSDPAIDPQVADGVVATLEVTLFLPILLQAVRYERVQQGLSDVAELTPEMTEQLPSMIKDAFRGFGCLLRETLKKVSLAQIFTNPDSLDAPLQEAAKSGVC